MSIYIVEDDTAVLDSLKVFLEDMNHKVELFLCAENFFKQTVPTASDTVIVDLCLPDIQGTQLIRWVSALNNRPNIIAISGHSDVNIDKFMRGLCEVPVLRKPLITKNLMELL